MTNARTTCDACGTDTVSTGDQVSVLLLKDNQPHDLIGSLCFVCYSNGLMWAARQAYKLTGKGADHA